MIVAAGRLHTLLSDILEGLGAPREYADTVATLLVEADLRGVDSHGAHLMALYAQRIRSGHLDPAAKPKIVSDEGSTLVLDAGLGFGQIAGLAAVHHAISRSEEFGIAAVAVREGTHLGALAAYTERVARAGRICLCFQNGPTFVPPFGGIDQLFSTNPLSYAIPTGDEPTIVFDVATTTVAGNKLLLAQKRGDASIPAGWATDADGVPTTDPAVASVRHLQWFGGHKGYGLALLVELLAGVLTGSSFGRTEHTASPVHGAERVAKGFLFLAIDPARFVPDFRARVDTLIRDVHASRPAAGVERVLVPGELEHERRQQRHRDGIPLPEALCAELDRYASEVGVPGLTASV
ncbi:Ldh family oxidoreductase [Cryptosporangium aurantiacum]|uniref:Malate/lactate/ureidoglycolate dehydrogenase, LDH2 family n=1 Tax=Cryptosporangium aurantiacum TaxID=134849 RepID=A0A1M7RK90_9ACTN|nr:Ldh family oxidoreductase [Cryptosporangium aurantiacum]SHN46571.1 Malate/lactate/ureidoglycolate dehydrogenase, LDH2 family [Cryptosporangium aurantiacum]